MTWFVLQLGLAILFTYSGQLRAAWVVWSVLLLNIGIVLGRRYP